MENKTIEIFVSVAYKGFTEVTKTLPTPEQLEAETNKLIVVSNKLGGHAEPFASRPTNVKKGQKYVGMPCPECQTPMIDGKKGPYCKPCYVAWKERQPA